MRQWWRHQHMRDRQRTGEVLRDATSAWSACSTHFANNHCFRTHITMNPKKGTCEGVIQHHVGWVHTEMLHRSTSGAPLLREGISCSSRCGCATGVCRGADSAHSARDVPTAPTSGSRRSSIISTGSSASFGPTIRPSAGQS
eukprot:TRINITY_DN36476_c0_g1_i1.p1 TRINITY_DN36476_c0_g1~~TRINITY_DN36476_c0_g1_i1.p1  ORF type:complete len:142 (-),score=3.50 TRINITY_DN36476_c0_g1_i1:2-427(-)